MKKERGESELSCGWQFGKFSLFYDHYAFFDTREYLADSLFIRHRVRVRFMEEYVKPEEEYRIIFCKCRKRDSAAFRAALEELPGKMLLCGHGNYGEFCRETKEKFSFAERPKRRAKSTSA